MGQVEGCKKSGPVEFTQKKQTKIESSLVVQWLRLHAFNAWGCGFDLWLGN